MADRLPRAAHHLAAAAADVFQGGVGPQHSYLRDSGRVDYKYIFDYQALKAFSELSKLEGIIPALEPSHALAYLLENAERFKNKNILLNLSGRGDKDLGIVNDFNLEEL